jgi:hypothetical protein
LSMSSRSGPIGATTAPGTVMVIGNGRKPGFPQLTKGSGIRGTIIEKATGFRDIGWRWKPPMVTGPNNGYGSPITAPPIDRPDSPDEKAIPRGVHIPRGIAFIRKGSRRGNRKNMSPCSTLIFSILLTD